MPSYNTLLRVFADPVHMAMLHRLLAGSALPLIGLDKDEITAEAQRLGTYSISIIPDQDCCTLFTPRHPATKARTVDVERAEATLPVDEIVGRAVAAAAVEDFQFPDVK